MKKSARLPIRWAIVLLTFSFAFPIGCKEGPEGAYSEDLYPDDPIERAKKIKGLREEATRWWEAFKRSEGSEQGADLHALERYAETLGECTKVDPTTCPRCYLDYGAALTRLGLYHETMIVALRAELQTASDAERQRMEELIAAHTEKYRYYYTNSNRQFDTYLRSTTGPIPLRVYQWLVQQCEALEDWDRALYYLTFIERDMTLNDDLRKDLAVLRKRYLRNLELKREKDAEQRELRRSSRLDAEARAEPAN